MKNAVFITGIGTDIGKTVASSVITKALKADYWKPIQAGNLEDSDCNTVRRLVDCQQSVFHPEKYKLTQPLSPHAAAKIDNVQINIKDITIPRTDNFLVIEGAGGLMVPINSNQTVADLIKFLNTSAIVVSKNYLGSINHTLLTIEALKTRNIPIIGILFNGQHTPESENIICSISNIKSLGRIDHTDCVTSQFIEQQANLLKDTLTNELIRAR
jgi:dethiobiotin synthetase